jgi:hypothetical protein
MDLESGKKMPGESEVSMTHCQTILEILKLSGLNTTSLEPKELFSLLNEWMTATLVACAFEAVVILIAIDDTCGVSPSAHSAPYLLVRSLSLQCQQILCKGAGKF